MPALDGVQGTIRAAHTNGLNRLFQANNGQTVNVRRLEIPSLRWDVHQDEVVIP